MRFFLSPHHPECPHPIPSRETTPARALHCACVILGGLERAGAHFGMPVEELRPMMEGKTAVPEPVFLAALEILLLHLEGAGPRQ
jgi:hypothetical protein